MVTEEKRGLQAVFWAALLCVLVSVPMLLVQTGFGGDDWAWLWVFAAQGPGALQTYVGQSGHPGLGPVLNAMLWLGGADAPQLSRIIALLCHLANGWLLWRIFGEGRASSAIAATVAIAYLAAPYLFHLRGSFAHTTYDVLLLAYLASIWLSGRDGAFALSGAVALCAAGLSLETLAALEPIRWWVLMRRKSSLKAVATGTLPFLGVILLAILLRATVFVPSGPYAGYNAVKLLAWSDYVNNTRNHLWFLADWRTPATSLSDLFRYDSVFVLLPLVAGAALVAYAAQRIGDAEPVALLAEYALLGIIVVGLGSLPYVLIDRSPDRIDFHARFAVAAQFGAILLMAAAVQALRFASAKAACVFGLQILCGAAHLQSGKWMLYEERAVGDFRRQVGDYLRSRDQLVLLVRFEPPGPQFLWTRRACLSSYDINGSLELAGLRGNSFVYDVECGPGAYTAQAGCSVTAFAEHRPCPATRREATFRLDQKWMSVNSTRLADLLARNRSTGARQAGVLIFPR